MLANPTQKKKNGGGGGRKRKKNVLYNKYDTFIVLPKYQIKIIPHKHRCL